MLFFRKIVAKITFMALTGTIFGLVVVPISLLYWLKCLSSYSHLQEQGSPPSPLKVIVSLLLPLLLAYSGTASKKLNTSGAVAALVISWPVSLINSTFFICMLTFYFFGSKATKFRIAHKTFERDVLQASARSWIQVLCNGFMAAQLTLHYYLEAGCVERPVDFKSFYNPSWWAVAVLSAISCCSGDTFASELGPVLPLSQPYLITNCSKVPKGTNGGVSIAGTVASALGGLVVGLAFYLSNWLFVSTEVMASSPAQWPVLLVCALAGMQGSLIDSLLGATLQYSGMAEDGCVVSRIESGARHIAGAAWLDNHSVNFLASFLTSVTMPGLAFTIWAAVTKV